MIKTNYPDLHLRVINMGVGGDTTRELLARWQTDVLDIKPDYVTIMIGVNDVWRQFDMSQISNIQISPEEYRENLRKLVMLTLPVSKNVIMISPFFMEPNLNDPMRVTIDKYISIMEEIAKEYGFIFVNTQKPFDEYFKHNHPMSVGWDRVHPDATGHLLIAKTILKETGFEYK